MATAKAPYDPVKSIEGMFNGSITRIGYMLKDPVGFGQGTKAVLAECSKRFQDSLDDCEIQLLDAKWYLEHQLALNKAKREAKAKEESAINAKRKHDEMKASGDKEGRDEAAKRQKVEDERKEAQKSAQAEQNQPQEKKPAAPAAPASSNTKSEVPQKPKPEEKPKTKPPESLQINTNTSKTTAQPPANNRQAQDSQQQDSAILSAMDDIPKPTPQATPSGTNDDFNFVSMFGDPSGDVNDDGGNNIDFDLDLGDDFGVNTNIAPSQNADDQPSFTSLLPGLESYANQTGDDNNFGLDGAGGGQGAGQGAMNFDLPNLGPNDFDDFLNDNDFGGGTFDGSLNLNDDSLTNMDNMENMDFESMFK